MTVEESLVYKIGTPGEINGGLVREQAKVGIWGMIQKALF